MSVLRQHTPCILLLSSQPRNVSQMSVQRQHTPLHLPTVSCLSLNCLFKHPSLLGTVPKELLELSACCPISLSSRKLVGNWSYTNIGTLRQDEVNGTGGSLRYSYPSSFPLGDPLYMCTYVEYAYIAQRI